MGKLDSALQAQGRRSSTDPVQAASLALLEKLSQDRSITNAQLANAIGQALEALYREVSKAIAGIDGRKDGASALKALAEIKVAIAEQVPVIERQVKALQRDIELVAKSVAAEISKSDARPIVQQLKSAIQAVKLPEADFAPVMAALEKQNELLQSTIMALAKREQKLERWSFEVEREDFSDKITNVIATRQA